MARVCRLWFLLVGACFVARHLSRVSCDTYEPVQSNTFPDSNVPLQKRSLDFVENDGELAYVENPYEVYRDSNNEDDLLVYDGGYAEDVDDNDFDGGEGSRGDGGEDSRGDGGEDSRSDATGASSGNEITSGDSKMILNSGDGSQRATNKATKRIESLLADKEETDHNQGHQMPKNYKGKTVHEDGDIHAKFDGEDEHLTESQGTDERVNKVSDDMDVSSGSSTNTNKINETTTKVNNKGEATKNHNDEDDQSDNEDTSAGTVSDTSKENGDPHKDVNDTFDKNVSGGELIHANPDDEDSADNEDGSGTLDVTDHQSGAANTPSAGYGHVNDGTSRKSIDDEGSADDRVGSGVTGIAGENHKENHKETSTGHSNDDHSIHESPGDDEGGSGTNGDDHTDLSQENQKENNVKTPDQHKDKDDAQQSGDNSAAVHDTEDKGNRGFPDEGRKEGVDAGSGSSIFNAAAKSDHQKTKEAGDDESDPSNAVNPVDHKKLSAEAPGSSTSNDKEIHQNDDNDGNPDDNPDGSGGANIAEPSSEEENREENSGKDSNNDSTGDSRETEKAQSRPELNGESHSGQDNLNDEDDEDAIESNHTHEQAENRPGRTEVSEGSLQKADREGSAQASAGFDKGSENRESEEETSNNSSEGDTDQHQGSGNDSQQNENSKDSTDDTVEMQKSEENHASNKETPGSSSERSVDKHRGFSEESQQKDADGSGSTEDTAVFGKTEKSPKSTEETPGNSFEDDVDQHHVDQHQGSGEERQQSEDNTEDSPAVETTDADHESKKEASGTSSDNDLDNNQSSDEDSHPKDDGSGSLTDSSDVGKDNDYGSKKGTSGNTPENGVDKKEDSEAANQQNENDSASTEDSSGIEKAAEIQESKEEKSDNSSGDRSANKQTENSASNMQISARVKNVNTNHESEKEAPEDSPENGLDKQQSSSEAENTDENHESKEEMPSNSENALDNHQGSSKDNQEKEDGSSNTEDSGSDKQPEENQGSKKETNDNSSEEGEDKRHGSEESPLKEDSSGSTENAAEVGKTEANHESVEQAPDNSFYEVTDKQQGSGEDTQPKEDSASDKLISAKVEANTNHESKKQTSGNASENDVDKNPKAASQQNGASSTPQSAEVENTDENNESKEETPDNSSRDGVDKHQGSGEESQHNESDAGSTQGSAEVVKTEVNNESNEAPVSASHNGEENQQKEDGSDSTEDPDKVKANNELGKEKPNNSLEDSEDRQQNAKGIAGKESDENANNDNEDTDEETGEVNNQGSRTGSIQSTKAVTESEYPKSDNKTTVRGGNSDFDGEGDIEQTSDTSQLNKELATVIQRKPNQTNSNETTEQSTSMDAGISGLNSNTSQNTSQGGDMKASSGHTVEHKDLTTATATATVLNHKIEHTTDENDGVKTVTPDQRKDASSQLLDVSSSMATATVLSSSSKHVAQSKEGKEKSKTTSHPESENTTPRPGSDTPSVESPKPFGEKSKTTSHPESENMTPRPGSDTPSIESPKPFGEKSKTTSHSESGSMTPRPGSDTPSIESPKPFGEKSKTSSHSESENVSPRPGNDIPSIESPKPFGEKSKSKTTSHPESESMTPRPGGDTPSIESPKLFGENSKTSSHSESENMSPLPGSDNPSVESPKPFDEKSKTTSHSESENMTPRPGSDTPPIESPKPFGEKRKTSSHPESENMSPRPGSDTPPIESPKPFGEKSKTTSHPESENMSPRPGSDTPSVESPKPAKDFSDNRKVSNTYGSHHQDNVKAKESKPGNSKTVRPHFHHRKISEVSATPFGNNTKAENHTSSGLRISDRDDQKGSVLLEKTPIKPLNTSEDTVTNHFNVTPVISKETYEEKPQNTSVRGTNTINEYPGNKTEHLPLEKGNDRFVHSPEHILHSAGKAINKSSSAGGTNHQPFPTNEKNVSQTTSSNKKISPRNDHHFNQHFKNLKKKVSHKRLSALPQHHRHNPNHLSKTKALLNADPNKTVGLIEIKLRKSRKKSKNNQDEGVVLEVHNGTGVHRRPLSKVSDGVREKAAELMYLIELGTSRHHHKHDKSRSGHTGHKGHNKHRHDKDKDMPPPPIEVKHKAVPKSQNQTAGTTIPTKVSVMNKMLSSLRKAPVTNQQLPGRPSLGNQQLPVRPSLGNQYRGSPVINALNKPQYPIKPNMAMLKQLRYPNYRPAYGAANPKYQQWLKYRIQQWKKNQNQQLMKKKYQAALAAKYKNRFNFAKAAQSMRYRPPTIPYKVNDYPSNSNAGSRYPSNRYPVYQNQYSKNGYPGYQGNGYAGYQNQYPSNGYPGYQNSYQSKGYQTQYQTNGYPGYQSRYPSTGYPGYQNQYRGNGYQNSQNPYAMQNLMKMDMKEVEDMMKDLDVPMDDDMDKEMDSMPDAKMMYPPQSGSKTVGTNSMIKNMNSVPQSYNMMYPLQSGSKTVGTNGMNSVPQSNMMYQLQSGSKTVGTNGMIENMNSVPQSNAMYQLQSDPNIDSMNSMDDDMVKEMNSMPETEMMNQPTQTQSVPKTASANNMDENKQNQATQSASKPKSQGDTITYYAVDDYPNTVDKVKGNKDLKNHYPGSVGNEKLSFDEALKEIQTLNKEPVSKDATYKLAFPDNEKDLTWTSKRPQDVGFLEEDKKASEKQPIAWKDKPPFHPQGVVSNFFMDAPVVYKNKNISISPEEKQKFIKTVALLRKLHNSSPKKESVQELSHSKFRVESADKKTDVDALPSEDTQLLSVSFNAKPHFKGVQESHDQRKAHKQVEKHGYFDVHAVYPEAVVPLQKLLKELDADYLKRGFFKKAIKSSPGSHKKSKSSKKKKHNKHHKTAIQSSVREKGRMAEKSVGGKSETHRAHPTAARRRKVEPTFKGIKPRTGLFGDIDDDTVQKCRSIGKSTFRNGCPDGWAPHNEFCYGFYKSKSRWKEFPPKCADHNAVLAMPKTEEELGFLHHFLRSRELAESSFHIGLTQRKGAWSWIDDSPYVMEAEFNDVNYHSKPLKGNRSCGVLQNGRIRNEDCDTKRSYICEVKRGMEAVRVLAFGDSLTKGFYGGGNVYHPYTDKLEYLLNKDSHKCYVIDNQGKDGELAKEMTVRLKHYLHNVTTWYSWVVILGGTNDILRDNREPVEKNWNKIVHDIIMTHQEAHKRGFNTVVVTIPETDCEESLNKFCLKTQKERQYVNDRLRHYAMETGAAVLSDLALLLPRYALETAKRDFFWETGIHMRPQGYDRMAEIIYQDLLKNLQEK